MNYYFSKGNNLISHHIIDLINSAQKSIDIAIYSLTKKEIVAAIINAKNRGVEVRLITDRRESQTPYEKKQLILLKNNNIPIKINSHSGLMHLKITIVDSNFIVFGSYNYTDAATYDNDEIIAIINDKTIAIDFKNYFENLWSNSKRFYDWAPKPS